MNLSESSQEFYKSLSQNEQRDLKKDVMQRVLAVNDEPRTSRTVQKWLNGGQIPASLYNTVWGCVRQAMVKKQKTLLQKQRELMASMQLVMQQQQILTQLIHF